MRAHPLVLRHKLDETLFAMQFLASGDFDIASLRAICAELDIPRANRKRDILNNIEHFLTLSNLEEYSQVILEKLTQRSKKWFTFRVGSINKFPKLRSPIEIVFLEGRPEWYGPYQVSDDDAFWYVRPHFPLLWEIDEKTSEPVERQLRWLCFARVTNTVASLHWQGFTIASDPDSIERGKQFPYWKHIPNFFDELEDMLGSKLEYPNLHELVLHNLWDKYRNKEEFVWTDTRIRAESGGVSLNARSSGANSVVDIDVRGIKHLARTISLAVIRKMDITNLSRGELNQIEETVLRTLIREFGTKSYEFSLETKSDKIMKAHFYFGTRPEIPGPDTFPHVNCFTSWRHDKEQFMFLLRHILSPSTPHVKDQSIQATLF